MARNCSGMKVRGINIY